MNETIESQGVQRPDYSRVTRPGERPPVCVLHSFPHKLGASRVSYAAWQHVQGLAAAGAEVVAFPGVLQKPLSPKVIVRPTLSRGKFRLPYKLLGRTGALSLHDWIVAKRLPALLGKIDLVHAFPSGALRTLRAAKALGIPTVLERCNAHTEFAYAVVRKECEKLGVKMPHGHEHAYNAKILAHEEAEFRAADYLFCPSEFVARTFLERGFSENRIARFQYGYDPSACYPPPDRKSPAGGLTVLFAAGCAPRKGLHYALEAWLQSSAQQSGTFLVVGEFIPGYAEKLAPMLSHPSVKRLGFRRDLPDVMRSADVFVLSSIEEGSALVTYDARACGCVLLSSDSTGAVCQHGENALVHRSGDVQALASHLTLLDQNRGELERLRVRSLSTVGDLTWAAAGVKMYEAYHDIVKSYRINNGGRDERNK